MTTVTTPRPAKTLVLDPNTQRFLDKLAAKPGTPIQELAVRDARALLRGLQAGPTAKLDADIDDRTLQVGPQGRISVRIVRPRANRAALPAIVYFHGGGWVLGDVDTHDRLVRELAIGAQAAVVFVNFSPSPEARYPVALEEGYAVLDWIARHGGTAALDGTRIAVAGDSAGGNLAAALTLLAKRRNGPKIAQQLLFYPVTDANFATGSYDRFAQGFFLTRDAMKWFWDAYAPEAHTREESLVSPLRASLSELAGLPPALVFTAEADVLRDEGEAYARKLIEAGVSVTAQRCLGLAHDFAMLDVYLETPGARTAITQASTWLAHGFAKH